jgi:hypothetical protein
MWRAVLIGNMYQAISDEFRERQIQKRQQLKELETKIISERLPAIGDALYATVNSGSADMHTTQGRIDTQIQAVQRAWQEYNGELEKWKALIGDFNRIIQALGDVGVWAQQIQTDIQTVVEPTKHA